MDDQPIYYVAAGGVVVDSEKVLVLKRPSRQEVRLPKGHLDEGEDAQMAALREVTEESGYAGLTIKAELGSQIVEFEYLGKRIIRTEYYFLMTLSDGCEQTAGEAQFEPVWLRWQDSLDQLSFEAEREWVRRARKAVEAL